jgi:hypothetical protein
MGTSAGYTPPSGDQWNSLKRQMGILLDKPEKKELVLSKFVKAIGGAEGFSSSNRAISSSVSTGSKRSFKSSSARKTSQNVLGFFSDINVHGLAQALETRNIDLNNKTIDEIKETLINYFIEPSIDADTDAASRAIATIMDDLFNDITTEEELENYFTNIISTEKAEKMLCGFYENYIFELFARTFFEDRTQHSNQSDTIELLDIVKETIKSKISTHQCRVNLKDIDFSGQAGANFVQGILNDILEILEGV